MNWYVNRVFKPEDYSPEAAQREQVELLVKAGRRCAYDLRHAADLITNDSKFAKIFYDRANLWEKVFNPADDGKNYRHHLHNVIESLESRVEKLEKRCVDNGVDISDLIDNDIPF
jgi:hypothetical protein